MNLGSYDSPCGILFWKRALLAKLTTVNVMKPRFTHVFHAPLNYLNYTAQQRTTTAGQRGLLGLCGTGIYLTLSITTERTSSPLMAPHVSAPAFDCAVCLLSHPSAKGIRVTPTDDLLCSDCFEQGVKPQFVAALKHEHAYPVKWGGKVLDPADFAAHLPPGFALRYLFAAREYQIPVRERVYCNHLLYTEESTGWLSEIKIMEAVDANDPLCECGSFLGALMPPSEARATYVCLKCNGSTCGICASSILERPQQHVCEDVTEECKEEDAFEGLVKGQDYQICPGCAARVELRDGCNHIFCMGPGCRATFCFVCGAKLEPHETEHFRQGKCPRWNQPGSRYAHFDPPAQPQRRNQREAVQAGARAAHVDPFAAPEPWQVQPAASNARFDPPPPRQPRNGGNPFPVQRGVRNIDDHSDPRAQLQPRDGGRLIQPAARTMQFDVPPPAQPRAERIAQTAPRNVHSDLPAPPQPTGAVEALKPIAQVMQADEVFRDAMNAAQRHQNVTRGIRRFADDDTNRPDLITMGHFTERLIEGLSQQVNGLSLNIGTEHPLVLERRLDRYLDLHREILAHAQFRGPGPLVSVLEGRWDLRRAVQVFLGRHDAVILVLEAWATDTRNLRRALRGADGGGGGGVI
ncbi:hypothetical protein BAUCODRAFT_25669 [Baudoinia panamericana UAMH 10762]|uniref:RING-type domain-containing protein n=1 Tax=Baudoinia panamericana (strain UAMH 10762) TaxID=717646 RepID=M2N6U5_BAUPA|nr:uncharacterized protein BAUCODRAFT_25669 [Baudoinia panamericana UAMH 10762]EMC94490.1 hypothetical protein BAUCODRAFT_25669 [Baudoinia panamericana UAMH 10762]